MNLKGKRALVTGGAVRIGRAITEALQAAGAEVVVHYRNSKAEAEALSPLTVQADLQCLEECSGLIEQAGPLDILINNASIFTKDSLADATPERVRREFQINLFDDMDQQLNEDFLRYTLDEFDAILPMIEDITTAWKNGNTEKLATLLNDDFFEQYPHLFDKIVTERNNAWVQKIETMAGENKNVLVIVGALHLVGANGIVEQLRRKGLRVTQSLN